MHLANERVWKYFVERYHDSFLNARVVEFGSYDINGSIRPLIEPLACEYIGVDWRPGPRVDVVSLAHEVKFGRGEFDAVVSASMLEHDPYWRGSLTKMVEVLRVGGLLAMTWGDEHCPPHCKIEAPDKRFHGRAARDVLEVLKSLDVEISISKFEIDFEFNSYLLSKTGKKKDKNISRCVMVLSGFKRNSGRTWRRRHRQH